MRAEALSSSNYKNAVKFLCDLDVLFLRRDKDKKDRKETVVYSLTDDRSEVESLRQRLFKFL